MFTAVRSTMNLAYRTPVNKNIFAAASSSTAASNYQPKPYDGKSYDHILKIRKENIPSALKTNYKKPLMITHGKAQWLFDQEGKKYLDMFAGIVTVSVGHCHPKVNAALTEQLNKIWHTTTIYMNPYLSNYVEKLVATLPGKLKVAYIVNSGSEANDLALLMARSHTGNYDIVTFRGAYHGLSPGTMSLTSLNFYKTGVPHSFGIHNTKNPDVFRGLWGGSQCRDSPVQTIRQCNCKAGQCHASDMYLKELQETLDYSVPKTGVAGFFAESIQGVGGTIQYPKNYIKRAFELIRSRGGICVSDEVQTGFGRTGEHFWGFQMHDVVPDIVTMAKGIGNGFPMAAVVTTPEIAESFSKTMHFNTYGGNPLACAAGSAVLDVIAEEGLQENSLKVGTYLLEQLAKLRDEHSIIGDVRGKGLMIGVEMVTDKESLTPLPAAAVQEIQEDAKNMGVIIGAGGFYGNLFRIKPPMIITKENVDLCISTFDKAIKNYLKQRK